MKNLLPVLFCVYILSASLCQAQSGNIKIEKTGQLIVCGDKLGIQFFGSGWKQVLQNQKSTVIDSHDKTGEVVSIAGKLNSSDYSLGFSKKIKLANNSAEVAMSLNPEKEVYSFGLSYTVHLSKSRYSGATLSFDGKPVVLSKEKGGKLPEKIKVKRIALSNNDGSYVICGDLKASLMNFGWGYQLRIFFSPESGKIKEAKLNLKIDTGEKALTEEEKKVLNTLPNIVYRENEHWKKIDMSDIRVKAGSALDLSWMTTEEDIPAGKFGRIMIRNDGKPVFENRPDMPVRFQGFNWIFERYYTEGKYFLPTDKDNDEVFKYIEIFADLVKRQGYNLVRLHCLDAGLMRGSTEGDFMIPQKNWERFDYLLKCFRERGIYVYLDLAIVGYYNGGWTPSARHKLREKLYFDVEGARDHWKTGATKILNHVNPYSKLAVKDDPIVVGILFYNEQDISTMPWQGYRKGANKIYQDGFHKWLKKKYKTIDAVKTAWSDADTDKLASIEEIDFNGTQKVPTGKKREDMSRFYYDIQKDLLDFYKSVMLECGYKGLVTHNDVIKNLRTTALRNEVDFVSIHDYGAHPSNSLNKGSTIGTGSTIAAKMWYWRSAHQARLLHKPIMVTEYAVSFWNPYSHEGGIGFPAYSSFQDYTSIMVHADAVALDLEYPIDAFGHYRSPVFRANEFLSAFLYRRGDVKPALGCVEIKVDKENVFKNGQAEDALNTDQGMLALVTKTGLIYSDKDEKKIGSKADLVLKRRQAGAKIVSTSHTSTAVDTESKKLVADEIPNSKVLKILQNRKVIPAKNKTDFDREIYQSDTGELTLYAKKSLLTVVTDRTEAATLLPQEALKLNFVTIQSTSVPASVAVIPLDKKSVDKSSHMVLVYNTNAVNTDMELSHDRSMMLNQGRLPVLMECGELKVIIDNDANLQLWALAMDGTRKEKIPVQTINGKNYLTIDTALLKNGPTPFFELVAE